MYYRFEWFPGLNGKDHHLALQQNALHLVPGECVWNNKIQLISEKSNINHPTSVCMLNELEIPLL